MNKYFFLIFLILIQLYAQPSQSRPPQFLNNDVFFTNVVALPNSCIDSITILFAYTILYDGIVFHKDNNVFYATPEIEAVFQDSNRITRKRFLSKDTIYAASFEETQIKTNTFTNYSTFKIARNNYKITSKFNNSKAIRSTAIETYLELSGDVHSPVLLQFEKHHNLLSNFIQKDCIPFSNVDFIFFIPISDSNFINLKDIDIIYEINKKTSSIFFQLNDTINQIGTATLIHNSTFDIVQNNTQHYFTLTSDDCGVHMIKIEESSGVFTPGHYTLSIITNPITSYNKTIDFEVKWFNMPLSLFNQNYALEQMYLILTDDEYKKMRSNNKKELYTYIWNYWKERDPTPTSAYNEAMTTFFKRIDYAEENFKTITQKEGTKSDRGKVYILNGEPTSITNEVKDKKNFEIWHYDNLYTKYFFEVVSVGNFKLVKITQ